ncbi:related to isoamyl alcohol oxidase [Cephalotrichum gorgonifer]|uniref:Related to isoamyl alcohol oxidase n=1 Tax=Cephalotrichum gorgonifer TaxID=2041049 RepID=A0AAE8MYN3_9PEZI|nr:related to isoamyl alcohol oxidase [Cephalotrichum gorgonifer]
MTKSALLVLISALRIVSSHPNRASPFPAAEKVPSCSHGASFSLAERIRLTDEVVERIADTHPEYADLWSFGNGEGSLIKSGECRSFPGDESWPSEDVWNNFNELLGENALIRTVPLAAVCYNSWGVYDEEKCASLREEFGDPYVHERDPTSTVWPIYQGKTCLPTDEPEGTCVLGGSPAYAVNVSTVAQVQLAVNMARNANLRLVIKNTGHCYLGKSNGAGALSVWTHNLKGITFLPEYETVGYTGPAMKVEAGATVREVYEMASRYNVTALGGICESVGYAGGYIAGGGHTPMSGLYGMAADHVMSLEVVTADGRFVTASNTSNPDLFWALRGGGGGTYGIVTSVVIRVHPQVYVTTSDYTVSTQSGEAYFEALRFFFGSFIEWGDAGTYSFFAAGRNGDTYTLSLNHFFAPNCTAEEFEELMGPWYKKLAELNISIAPTTKFYEDFYSAYDATWGSDVELNTVGSVSILPANRLFPRSSFEDEEKFDKTFAVLQDTIDSSNTIMGYHQAPGNRANVDNAVSSAFRSVIAFLIVAVFVDSDATPEELGEATRVLNDEIVAPWREVSPSSEGGGSYLNEANVMEPNWQREFYGVQYERLLEIKKAVDPMGVFYATTGVGSEEWEVRDGKSGLQTQNGRLCRL